MKKISIAAVSAVLMAMPALVSAHPGHQHEDGALNAMIHSLQTTVPLALAFIVMLLFVFYLRHEKAKK